MRSRNIKIQFWIDDDEARKLAVKSKKCNLSQAAFLRQHINGFVPREAPPLQYYEILQELRAIGNSIQQVSMYRQNADRILAVCDILMSAFAPQAGDTS